MTKKTKSSKKPAAKKPAPSGEGVVYMTPAERAKEAKRHHPECEDPGCGGCSKTARAATRRATTKAAAKPAATEKPAKAPRARDPRIPANGTVLKRPYKETEIVVEIREDGFHCEGAVFTSLSAIASKVTGSPKNGILWFGLTKREPKSKVAGQDPPAAADNPAIESPNLTGSVLKRAGRKTKTTSAGGDAEPTEQGVDAPA